MKQAVPRLHVMVERAGQIVYRGTHDVFPIHFGRGADCAIQLPYGFISRNHGSITVENGLVIVKDLGSRHKMETERGSTSELRIDGRGHFKIADLEINLRLEKDLSEDPEKTQAVAAPTRTFQKKPMTIFDGDLRNGDHRGDSRRSTLEKNSTRILARPLTVPSPPAPAPEVVNGAETVRAMEPDVEKKKTDVRPLFEGAMGEFQWVLDPEISMIQSSSDVAVQGAVSWGPHLFDIRNFIVGDRLRISPSLNDEISLPALGKVVKLGKFESHGALFNLPRSLSWSLRRNGTIVEEALLRRESRLKDHKNDIQLMLQKEEILTVNFNSELKSHFRYIKRPMPFFPRTWIENKEQFKRAIQVSLVVHLILSAVALFSAPEVKAPEVENIPKRFAKLLVEPPKQVLPEPPPEAPPLPPPPPEPVIPEKPPEPPPPKPKAKQKPVKPVAKPPVLTERPKPMPAIVKAEPVVQMKSTPVVAKVTPPMPSPAQKDLPKSTQAVAKGEITPQPKPPAPTPAEVEAAALQQMFNSMPNQGASNSKLPDHVKLVKTGGTAAPGIKVGGMVSQVPNAGGATASGVGKTPSALAEAGQAGYAATTGGKAGHRKIGGISVENPKLEGAQQGLSMVELMTVVNRYLADIQRCYERALVDQLNLVGRIEYEWEISPTGSVKNANVKRSEMSGADELNECVLKVIRKMPFPQSKNGLSTITSVGFPFGKQ